ncbi:MAG TPA: TatD family hydrolase [Kiritimatiellia bacterium]
MFIIDPHIHCISRTTDDYHRMYDAGIRAVVEPSFWLGQARRYAGSFFDYFQHILEFEATRAAKFGIDHYACIAMNPKEADALPLADEVVDGLGPYVDHPRCVAVGEIGFNLITPNEERILQRQLELAKAKRLLIMIHSPHDTPTVSKKKGIERTIAIVKELNYEADRILMDHNTEETMALTRKAELWAGLSVYPYSKLNPERVTDIAKKWGLDKLMANSAADWGVADPCSIPNVAKFMSTKGFTPQQVERFVFENPLNFYKQSGRFTPKLDLPFVHPSTYQR